MSSPKAFPTDRPPAPLPDRWKPLQELLDARHAIAGVVFDAVGTLIHPVRPIAHTYQAWGHQFGSQLSIGQVAARFTGAFRAAAWQPATNEQHRAAWRQIVSTVFDDVDDPGGALFESLWEYFGRPASWAAYQDVEPLFDQLASRKLRLAIASNFDDRLLRICGHLVELASCRLVMPATRLGSAKPDPDFFLGVAARLQLPPHQLVMVGDDSELDVAAARAAGWSAALISSPK